MTYLLPSFTAVGYGRLPAGLLWIGIHWWPQSRLLLFSDARSLQRPRNVPIVVPEQRLGRLFRQLAKQAHFVPERHADRVREVDGSHRVEPGLPMLHLVRDERWVVVLPDTGRRVIVAVVVEVEMLGPFGVRHAFDPVPCVREGWYGDVRVIEGVDDDHEAVLVAHFVTVGVFEEGFGRGGDGVFGLEVFSVQRGLDDDSGDEGVVGPSILFELFCEDEGREAGSLSPAAGLFGSLRRSFGGGSRSNIDGGIDSIGLFRGSRARLSYHCGPALPLVWRSGWWS